MTLESRLDALQAASVRHMIYRCTILRNSTATTNAWGSPDSPSWTSNITNLPCIPQVQGGIEDEGSERTIVETSVSLLIPKDQDITESDRVGDITLEGVVYMPGTFDIESVLVGDIYDQIVLKGISS